MHKSLETMGYSLVEFLSACIPAWSTNTRDKLFLVLGKELSMTLSHTVIGQRKPYIPYAVYFAIDANYLASIHDAIAAEPTARQ
jgi:hypothetical protein